MLKSFNYSCGRIRDRRLLQSFCDFKNFKNVLEAQKIIRLLVQIKLISLDKCKVKITADAIDNILSKQIKVA